jgi:hypothetical protein
VQSGPAQTLFFRLPKGLCVIREGTKCPAVNLGVFAPVNESAAKVDQIPVPFVENERAAAFRIETGTRPNRAEAAHVNDGDVYADERAKGGNASGEQAEGEKCGLSFHQAKRLPEFKREGKRFFLGCFP